MLEEYELWIDGEMIQTKTQLHRMIKEGLHLSEEYGNNLDALHDVLTETRDHIVLHIQHYEALAKNLGSYASHLIQLLSDVEEEVPNIELVWEENEEKNVH